MPTTATAIVTLPQTKTHLKIEVDTFDAQLNDYIEAASQMVVNRIGQVAGSPTIEEYHDGGVQQIVLRNQAPIQSVTSVLESFGTVNYTLTQVTLDAASGNAFAYTVELDRGLITRRASGIAVPFAPGIGNVHVTYVAGYATTPADITLRTLRLIQAMWIADQRGPKPRGGGAPEMPTQKMDALADDLFGSYMVPGIG